MFAIIVGETITEKKCSIQIMLISDNSISSAIELMILKKTTPFEKKFDGGTFIGNEISCICIL